MAARYLPEDYLYASARVRAREARMPGAAQLRRWGEAGSVGELTAALAADGYTGDVEQILFDSLRTAFDTVRVSLPDPAAVAFLQYPYDVHNIKVYLKAAARGVDPLPLSIDLGTVPVAQLGDALEGKEYALPAVLCEAAARARAQFEQSKNPQEIDFVLDRACFTAMRDAAATIPFAADLVAMRADLVNVQMLLRVMRLGLGEAGRALLLQALVPGGTLETEFLLAQYEQDEAALAAALSRTPFAQLWGSDTSLSALERRADDLLMARVQRVKYIPYGAEVPIAYLWGLESAVRNLRILYTGLLSGADKGEIAKRVRESYV